MIYFYWFLFFFLLVNLRAINRSVGGITQNVIDRFFGVHTGQPKAAVVLKPKAQIEQAAFDRIEAMYKETKE